MLNIESDEEPEFQSDADEWCVGWLRKLVQRIQAGELHLVACDNWSELEHHSGKEIQGLHTHIYLHEIQTER